MSYNKENLKEVISENVKSIKALINNNLDTLKHYKIMTDISQLKVNYFIKYMKRDNEDKLYYGGQVDSIDHKENGDYSIVFKSNNGLKWSLLLSRVFIFYRAKPMTEIRKEEHEKWKADMEKNHPEEYEKWKQAKKEKEMIRKMDPELYKKMYVHVKTSNKK